MPIDGVMAGDATTLPGGSSLCENAQDVGLVERVQQGLQSRAYRGGKLCFRFEEPVHRFQNMLIDLMTGVTRIPGGDEHEEAPTLVPTAEARSASM